MPDAAGAENREQAPSYVQSSSVAAGTINASYD